MGWGWQQQQIDVYSTCDAMTYVPNWRLEETCSQSTHHFFFPRNMGVVDETRLAPTIITSLWNYKHWSRIASPGTRIEEERCTV